MIALSSRWATPSDVTRFAHRYLAGSGVRLVRDPTGAVAKAYGIETHPTFVAFDRGGRRIADTWKLSAALDEAGFDARSRR